MSEPDPSRAASPACLFRQTRATLLTGEVLGSDGSCPNNPQGRGVRKKSTFSDDASLVLRRASSPPPNLVWLGPQPRRLARQDSTQLPTIKPGTNASFASLKQIDAGVLNVGYAEAGPRMAPVVILLHGWPYDIHSYVDVAPLLASAGYRGDRSLSARLRHDPLSFERTARNGQQSVLAVDIIALMDALKIEKAILAGYDWGARTANIVAALWPERCKAMVSVSGYLIGSQEASKDAAAAEGRAAMVVSVLLRHRTRPRRLREISARLCEAHLAARLAEVGLRRRHVRSQRGGLRQSRITSRS